MEGGDDEGQDDSDIKRTHDVTTQVGRRLLLGHIRQPMVGSTTSSFFFPLVKGKIMRKIFVLSFFLLRRYTLKLDGWRITGVHKKKTIAAETTRCAQTLIAADIIRVSTHNAAHTRSLFR